MSRDPIIDEVRRVRREIDEERTRNPKAYAKRLKEIEAKFAGRVSTPRTQRRKKASR
jgi:hypothetical protein